MVIKIDFESLSKVVLDELERQGVPDNIRTHPENKPLFSDTMKEHPKMWLAGFMMCLLAIDGKDI